MLDPYERIPFKQVSVDTVGYAYYEIDWDALSPVERVSLANKLKMMGVRGKIVVKYNYALGAVEDVFQVSPLSAPAPVPDEVKALIEEAFNSRSLF